MFDIHENTFQMLLKFHPPFQKKKSQNCLVLMSLLGMEVENLEVLVEWLVIQLVTRYLMLISFFSFDWAFQVSGMWNQKWEEDKTGDEKLKHEQQQKQKQIEE